MFRFDNFDASKIPAAAAFEPLPAGRYLAMITASEMRPNKAGTGSYLELVFTILEGEHKGRQLWSRLNLDHPNELAVKIAKSELAAICRAVGVLTPRDSAELHNLPLTIRVAHKQRKDTGETVSVIVGYTRRDVAPNTSPSTPPWRR